MSGAGPDGLQVSAFGVWEFRVSARPVTVMGVGTPAMQPRVSPSLTRAPGLAEIPA